MTAPLTAYIDMEFAGIYGTRQSLQIPLEIGVVLHDPLKDSLSFSGQPFRYEIDVEHWKNITDKLGRRVDGQRRVFCLADPSRTHPFEHRFCLDKNGMRHARSAILAVHDDLRMFMQRLNHADIGTLVFFARQRELAAFRQARIRTDGFLIRDLQYEIQRQMALKEHISLDRMSLIIGFALRSSSVSSLHFLYRIPEKFQYLVKPHKAIGDAARMFLVDQEFRHFTSETTQGVKDHRAHYEQARQVRNAIKIDKNEENPGF